MARDLTTEVVLVTGGCGYIGSHTVVSLAQAGASVVIVDTLWNSSNIVLQRLEELTARQFPFYQIDVSNKNQLKEVFEKHSITSIIHFAAHKAVGESVKEPIKYYQNNLGTTLTLLELMAEYKVYNFVFSSSATVYDVSNPKNLPVFESSPLGAISPYGHTKVMNEQILSDAAFANQNLAVISLRYFNPIGAHESGRIGEDPQGIPNNLLPFVAQVAVGRREKLFVFGNDYPTRDGTPIRDYIHVVDLAEGHVAALQHIQDMKGFHTFNLGTGKGSTVLEVIETFEKASGRKIPHEIVGRRQGDAVEVYANCDKANKVLNWVAKRNLTDMCIDSWRWQSQNLHGYNEETVK